MRLLVFRHGIAQDESEDGSDDSRTLTDTGVRKTTEAARGLTKLADRPDMILTSPKARAVQTAQIVGRAFDRKPRVLDALGDQDLARILKALASRRERTVMIVGHEPSLGELVERLCTGRSPRSSAPIGGVQLKKAGCACIECPDPIKLVGGGELLWLATPKMLRDLAR